MVVVTQSIGLDVKSKNMKFGEDWNRVTHYTSHPKFSNFVEISIRQTEIIVALFTTVTEEEEKGENNCRIWNISSAVMNSNKNNVC